MRILAVLKPVWNLLSILHLTNCGNQHEDFLENSNKLLIMLKSLMSIELISYNIDSRLLCRFKIISYGSIYSLFSPMQLLLCKVLGYISYSLSGITISALADKNPWKHPYIPTLGSKSILFYGCFPRSPEH